MPRKDIWISKSLAELVKRHKINLSKFVREKLTEYFQQHNIEIPEDDPELIVLVRCPHCSYVQKTTTIRTVRCFNCGKRYSVLRRKGFSRIVRIIKGDQFVLTKMFYRYNKP